MASALRRFDPARLRLLLGLFFGALAAPAAILIWQAYGQLKWEALHLQRTLAEALVARIDEDLQARIASAESRAFADFSFLTVSGDPSANLVQRSPLSEFPVRPELPGLIGYFQVDTDGGFSTPLLPQSGDAAGEFGIPPDEYAARHALAETMRATLADNRLIRERVAPGKPTADREQSEPERRSADARASSEESVATPSAGSIAEDTAGDAAYSQLVFDELTERTLHAAEALPAAAQPQLETEAVQAGDELADAAVLRKSETGRPATSLARSDNAVVRQKRIERSAVPEPAVTSRPDAGFATVARIRTFESEIDPYEFSLLDSGDFVLFRKVWRDGERLIQGALIDRRAFVGDAVGDRFRTASLARAAALSVRYRGDVIERIAAEPADRYAPGDTALRGDSLYRARLSAPLDRIELDFSVTRLPPGPGAGVLAWASVALTLVLLAGTWALYRLGKEQLALARQQQDFVSAVSHELKTPLTSIRMYGEILREGWAAEDKKRSYYEYIHDEAERLTRLITNVLRLARLTHGEPDLEIRAHSVGTLLDQIESKVSTQIDRAGFRLDVDAGADVRALRVEADADAVSQIFINLVDNAIKFSRDCAERRVVLGATAGRGGNVILGVRDFGPGIPRDQMKKIFRLFYRPQSELTRETVGTGIGLAIVHQLSHAMGGSVDVVNREPGAEFRVTLAGVRDATA